MHMRDVFIKTLSALAAKNPDIVLITGDLGFRVLDDFEKRFPRQYLNAGVAEQNMTALATGMALEGRIVFTYSIANFPTLRCLEQVRNDVCYHDANVNIVCIGGGFSYGALGGSHHATEDIAILRSIPNMTVLVPSDNWEVEGATEILAARPGPGYLRLDKSTPGYINAEADRFELGRARLIREGGDITLITAGGILVEVLNAAETLAEKGIQARVLSMHTVSDIDVDALRDAARQTGGIITVEEHSIRGGLGGAVAEVCLEQGFLPGFFNRMGLRPEFTDVVGDQAYLRHHCGLDAASIAENVERRLLRSDGRVAVAT